MRGDTHTHTHTRTRAHIHIHSLQPELQCDIFSSPFMPFPTPLTIYKCTGMHMEAGRAPALLLLLHWSSLYGVWLSVTSSPVLWHTVHTPARMWTKNNGVDSLGLEKSPLGNGRQGRIMVGETRADIPAVRALINHTRRRWRWPQRDSL